MCGCYNAGGQVFCFNRVRVLTRFHCNFKITYTNNNPSLPLLFPARLSRTQKMGRIHKHIADQYLIAGQLQPACDHFGYALSLLSRDPLWEGSANEGLGATLIMKKKHDDLRQGSKSAELTIPSNAFGFLKVSQRILKVSKFSFGENFSKRGQNSKFTTGKHLERN